MTYLGCETCMATLQVHGDPDEFRQLIIEHPMWEHGRPCTTFGCPGSMNPLDLESREAMGQLKKVIPVAEVSVQEAFRALCGGGLPAELGLSPEFVAMLLESDRPKEVFAKLSPTGRTLISHIRVGELMLHLSSSSFGPCVYKITRVTDEQLGDDRADVHQGTADGPVQLEDEGDEGHQGGGGPVRGGAHRGEGGGTVDHEQDDHQSAPGAARVPAGEGDDGTPEAEDVSAAGGTR